MNCTVCNGPISEVRLKAIPGADKCITCASQNDVSKVRRFDERAGEDIVEDYYTGPDTPEIIHRRERLDRVGFGAWSYNDDYEGFYGHPVAKRPRTSPRTARDNEIVSVAKQGNLADYAEDEEDENNV